MLQPQKFPETRASLFAAMRGEAGWREFFNRYAPAVFRVARYRGLDAHDAEDIVQQVMIAIARHIDSYEIDDGRRRFRTWVRTITERKIIDLVRRRQRHHAVPIADTPEPWDSDAEWREEWHLLDVMESLEQVAKRISPQRMRAFRMYSLEGRPADEVARICGMSRGHVYVTRCQVLEMIRAHIDEAGGSDEGSATT